MSCSYLDMSKANGQQLQKMSESMTIYKSTLTAGMALYVPWGFVVVEQTENSADVCGLRWMLCGSASTPGFAALTSFVVPAGSQVTQGSSGELLQQIHVGLASVHGGAPAIEEQVAPVKAEPDKKKQKTNK